MDTCDHAPHILLQMHDPTSLMLHWLSFPRWGRECFACFLCNSGSRYFVYNSIWPVPPPDYPRYTTNNRWCSIDAQFQDVVGGVGLFILIIKVSNTSKWTVMYQCQYLTINTKISECDHKYETRYLELEIGTNGSSQTWQIFQVNGYVAGFHQPRVSGSGCWTGLEPNKPVCVV
jgi:hypothetical protein